MTCSQMDLARIADPGGKMSVVGGLEAGEKSNRRPQKSRAADWPAGRGWQAFFFPFSFAGYRVLCTSYARRRAKWQAGTDKGQANE